MTPADKRITDLLDRWLASIELHLKYAALDEAAYRAIQPWPDHERPSRWILEVAQQKVLQLKSLCHMHSMQQDGSFAEGLELMCFLANLVGAQNIKRFIPIADPSRELSAADAASAPAASATPAGATAKVNTLTPPVISAAASPVMPPVNTPAPSLVTPPAAPHAIRVAPLVAEVPKQVPPAPPIVEAPVLDSVVDGDDIDGPTRELPRLKPTANGLSAKQINGDSDKTREMPAIRPPTKKPAASAPRPPQPAATPKPSPADAAKMAELVTADAVRLLKWGREWHELAELIARMAERPNIAEVRRILRSKRGTIESLMDA